MKCFVTGGAGFVGSHLVDRLVAAGHGVTVYDNLSSGRREFISGHIEDGRVRFIEEDLLHLESLSDALRGQEAVFHLAANPDIRAGITETRTDLDQGAVVTYNVLEAMRRNGVRKIVFSSSSVVYGEPSRVPTPEDYGPLQPISLYGASKLSCEGLITAFGHTFGIRSWIFRFANIVGARSTHGILFDFREKLRKSPNRLEVLGDGNQRKSYLEVGDCVDGILFGFEKAAEPFNLFNLGSGDNVSVREIAETLLDEIGSTETEIVYTGGKRGWPGDVPTMRLSVEKINRLGWKAPRGSRQAIRVAIRALWECRP